MIKKFDEYSLNESSNISVMKRIKTFKIFESTTQELIGYICDFYEVGEEGYNQLNNLLTPVNVKISEDDDLIQKIFDIVITNNKTEGHKGPLLGKQHTKVSEIKNFIKTNEQKIIFHH